MQLIKPTKISIVDLDGVEHAYQIGRFPAVEGLEIIAKVPSNLVSFSKQLPQLRGLVLQMCKFVEAEIPKDDGSTHAVRLVTSDLIDNNVPDGQTLLHLCFEIMRHNTSFFGKGSQSMLDFLGQKLADSLPRITQMFQGLLESSYPKDSQP